MKATRQPTLRFQDKGFSLLEVLIAVVVLSIGLLGLAGLQVLSLRNNTQSYERSQATVLAYEIADAMRSNRIAAGAGAFELAANAIPADGLDCVGDNICTTRTQAAAYALEEWHRRLRTALPAGTARIACSVSPCALGTMQTISVIWDENRTGAANASCPAADDFDEGTHLACVQVSLAP
ncbi:MAG: type IV pilus modification protein PilV [Panacagrimonas sp.]